jgi:hypothetical protein
LFEGNFKDGKRHGETRYVTRNKGSTEGTFKNNLLNGEGFEMQYDKIESYRGSFVNNLFHGQGTYTF